MTVTDIEIQEAMAKYGGSFVQRLARLWAVADDDNASRIKAAWPEYVAKYREIVEIQRRQAQ